MKGQPCERGRASRVWFSVLEKEKWKSGNDQKIGKKGISKNARGGGRAGVGVMPWRQRQGKLSGAVPWGHPSPESPPS